MATQVHYTITPASLGGHRYEVTIDIPDPRGESVLLTLPTWIPGSYLVRDFSKHVARVQAECNGAPLRVSKRDKSRWRVEPASGAVQVSYEVYAHDLSVRGAFLDTRHGFFNGSSVFLCVEGRSEETLTVDIQPPADEHHKDTTAGWRVATTLPRVDAPEWGFGRFEAASYAELIDHPVEIGHFELVSFEVAGTPHYFVLSGEHQLDVARLTRDASNICAEHVRLFGELPPMERYLFLTRVEASGYGGLEHRNSCALVCTRHSLPMGHATNAKAYRQFLGLVSHEYFHLWNVKRIKPAAFTPYDLTGESYTELLWVFEGITSYYDDLALVRSGVIDESSYAELLCTTVSRVRSAHGWRHQSLAESSFDAWVKFYKPDENASNAVVSYYAKGALVALALDLTLRGRCDVSLDDIMRRLWHDHGKKEVGVPEDGFEDLAAEVSGLHLRPFFDAMVRGTDDVQLEGLFENMGWALTSRADPAAPLTSLGVTCLPDSTKIKSVVRDSCAERCGLSAGDTLVAVNGLQVNAGKAAEVLMPYTEGDQVTVHAFRRGVLLSHEITLDARPHAMWSIKDDLHAEPKALDRRREWLHS